MSSIIIKGRNLSEEQIYNTFIRYGKITNITCNNEKHFFIVTFDDRRDANDALEMNDRSLDGVRVSVDFFTPHNDTSINVSEKVNRQCNYFNSPEGCRSGNNCRFLHLPRVERECNRFNTAQGCRLGDNCRFQHIDKECSFFLQHGRCKFGDNCKYSKSHVTNSNAGVSAEITEFEVSGSVVVNGEE